MKSAPRRSIVWYLLALFWLVSAAVSFGRGQHPNAIAASSAAAVFLIIGMAFDRRRGRR